MSSKLQFQQRAEETDRLIEMLRNRVQQLEKELNLQENEDVVAPTPSKKGKKENTKAQKKEKSKSDQKNTKNSNVNQEPKKELDKTDPTYPFRIAISEQISVFSGVSIENIAMSLEEPKNLSHGDLALPVPKLFKFAKISGKPNDICKEWASKFQQNELISEVSCVGNYLNFRFNKLNLMKQVAEQVFKQKEKYGNTEEGKGKTIIVEYSSPNIAKPFHAGHLRSTIIGNFLKNLYNTLGYKTIGINYLGDWGKQYGLLAVGFKRFGSEEEVNKRPIRHLFEVYVKINEEAEKDPSIHDQAREYFKKMEAGETEALSLWKKFREMSIGEYKNMYKRLNVEFDVYSGESMFGEQMQKEVKKLEDLNLLKESEGAQVVDLKEKKLNVALIKKKDGTTLYITRDIAAAVSRFEEFKFDKMFYVVGGAQGYHFQQLFAILEKMGYNWVEKCQHIGFGMVEGMKTRKGQVVFLEDILDEAKTTMLEQMKKNEKKFSEIKDPELVADIVGLSAVIIQDLSARRMRDYAFNWNRITSFEGDTGPYLQFAYARLFSIERKAAPQNITVNPKADLTLLENVPEAHGLALAIARFPSAIQATANTLEPCVLITYLFSLAHAISTASEKLWVLGKEKNEAEAVLLLYWCARITLGNGMKILGLKPLERM